MNEPQEGLRPIISAGMQLYKFTPEGLKILVGKRIREPWIGYTVCALGGKVRVGESVEQAALREAREETGGTLEIRPSFIVGCYGPRSFHHRLLIKETVPHPEGELFAEPTDIPIDDKHLFVHVVYAGRVVNGADPRDNEEIADLHWVDPLGLAGGGTELAFDQALVLIDFLCDPRLVNPETLKYFFTPAV